eukprot:Gb_10928 [translate_table: standard]
MSTFGFFLGKRGTRLFSYHIRCLLFQIVDRKTCVAKGIMHRIAETGLMEGSSPFSYLIQRFFSEVYVRH